MNQSTIHHKPHNSWHEQLILQLITAGVILNGVTLIASTLAIQLRPHHFGIHLSDAFISLPLVSGLTLVYLGTLLHRRKQAAWALALPLYTFIIGFNLVQLIDHEGGGPHNSLLRSLILPVIVVSALIYFRRVFTVKSAIQNFAISLRVILLLAAVTFVYGVSGYTLLDKHDFHQEISTESAIHHTIDQFDFTTNQALKPYTRRATVFVDTLSILTAATLGYAVVSLFQPVRSKLTRQSAQRSAMQALLLEHSTDSEDFFKIWPHDKAYYVDHRHEVPQAALAYRIQRGVAVVVGAPVGETAAKKQLLSSFHELCRVNDWLPAYVHIKEDSQKLLQKQDFQFQKIGEEAVVDIARFIETTGRSKHFREIRNKFAKREYSIANCLPPHDQALLHRLREISDDWLKLPGRQERSFLMGYFDEAYLQQCEIIVARDSSGTIEAFLNKVPTYQSKEANYDFVRHTTTALGNVNDYLLMNFIEAAGEAGYSSVNLGLCPLSGLDKSEVDRSVIDSALRFVYANGDRFYSFSGLHRFKSKYEPDWVGRYVAYRGGIRGFSRSVYALNKAMNRTK